MDLWSRKIVGWAMAGHLRSELAVGALQMARTQRRPAKGLLVHSDRGVQYASQETRAFLEQRGWVASMRRTGNPYDNAWMESAIGKIKNEVLGSTVPAMVNDNHFFLPVPPMLAAAALATRWRATLEICGANFNDFCFRGLPRFHFTGRFSENGNRKRQGRT